MKMRNPFREWMDEQPKKITQTSLASAIGCERSYINDLMHERSMLMPGLSIVVGIEKVTDGAVTPRQMYEFAKHNRRYYRHRVKKAA